MLKLLRIILFILVSLPQMLMAQDYNMYEAGIYIHKRDTMHYRILFPENFNPQKKYPVVFFLHGSAERGNDNKAQLKNGASLFLQVNVRKNYPAIVIFPQCSKGGSWPNFKELPAQQGHTTLVFQQGGEPTHDMKLLMGLTDEMLGKPFVDKHHVYIGGISLGGMGAFEILRRMPDVFAAAFPICGGDNTANAYVYAKTTALWIFHGEKDDVVPPEHSESMVVALKLAGGHPKFSLYPNDGHECWDDALAEPQLLPWLFSNSR